LSAPAVEVRDEAAELLRELIRVNTVNPPGNETAAAELLRDYLAESGVESELYAKVPERANLVARLPGSGDGPSMLLLSHTDTVVADPSEWQVDPWSGELRDDEEADTSVLEEARDVDLVRVGEQRVHLVLLGDGHSEAAVLDLDGETGRDGGGTEQDLGVRGREHGGVLDEFGEQVDDVGDGVSAQGAVDRGHEFDP
jgi:hypothetical protein